MTDSGTILVVDDDSESLRLLTDILSAEGYQVRPADSGELALAFVKARLPDLILLDIRMAGMDGLEVCRRLKSCQMSRAIPLMFLSVACEVEERVEGLRLGAVDFISKPFRREELLARVRTHLELGRLRAGLEKQVAQRTAELRIANGRLQLELAEHAGAEHSLRESEERFRNLADTLPVVIWVTDAQQLITFLNKQALTFTGREPEDLTPQVWAETVHPDDLDQLRRCYLSAVGSRSPFETELRLRRADGEYRWMLNTGIPRLNGGGYAGHVGTMIDITDLKRNQEQMLASQKLESLGVLAAGIAHDFNNLLASIYGEADLALMEISPDSPAFDGVQRIGAVAIRGAEIVNLLMAYAGSRGEETALEPVDLSLLVQEMLQLLNVSISKKAVLKTSLAQDLPAAPANAPQLRQVVMNLIMNASEALEDREGFITVATSRIHIDEGSRAPANLPAGDYVRLEVSDTGCGMTKDAQARAFDPFYTTKFLGRGLGLSVVQGILRSHGGAINVTSAKGQGSTFEVLLPCASRRADQTSRKASAQAAAGASSAVSGTILLVEDEETLRLAASKGLQKRGFSVLAAGDGRAAVDLFHARAAEIDAVLLDMTLPGMSGPEVFGEIRRVKPNIKVILTSAYDRESVTISTIREGQASFIRKPYQLNELVLKLQDTLSNRSSQSHDILEPDLRCSP